MRCALLVILLFSLGCRERTSGDVILVTIDTLRADAIGGGRTPFLDALAAKGTVFTRAHAHNVVTLPSHANILTGLLPWQHGIRDNAGFTLDAKHPTLATQLRDAGYATGAFVSAYPLDSRYGLDRGFDVYDDDIAREERPGAETLERAAAWWRGAKGKKRFLWVHLYEPHWPYEPAYPDEVKKVDDALARVLGPMLEESPGALVIVTADHGEGLGDHGEQTHGLFAYESTLAVPLIVVDPSREAARDDRYVQHIDLAPTILAHAGLTPPAAGKGVSLFAEGERGYTYFEALSSSLNRGWAPLVGAIDGGKKLIELPIPELYDLASDPRETRNRYAEERRAVFAMREKLKNDAPNATTAQRSIHAEEQATLLSLGYLTGTSAKTTYTEADDPKNLVAIDTQLHELTAAQQAGDLAKAEQLARAILAARPDLTIAQEMLGMILGDRGNAEEAIAVLQQRVASGQASEATRIRLGTLLSESGRGKEAIALLQPFANRNDVYVLNAYGAALAETGDLRGAVQTFQRVLSIDRNNAVAHQHLGIIALRAGDRARARASLERALALDPKLPLAHTILGVIEAESGNPGGAITRWERAVALNPNQLDALLNLGMVAAQQGRRDLAERALRDYLARAKGERYAKERERAQLVLQR